MALIFIDTNDVPNGLFGPGTTTCNMLPVTAAEAVFRLKELLKSAGWTIQASSDGTNFSNTAGNTNDQITSSTEMGNLNAWFVIKQPAIGSGTGAPGHRQLAFRKSSATEGSWTVTYIPLNSTNTAAQAPTVAGTATALPTYTSVYDVCGTYPSTAGTWFSTTANTYRTSIAADNAAPYGFYMFSYLVSSGSAATAGGCLIFDPLTSYDASDVDPYAFYCPSPTNGILDVSSSSATAASVMPTTHNRSAPAKLLYKSTLYEAWRNVSMLVYCSHDSSSTAGLINFPNASSTNPHTAEDDLLPVPYGRPASNTSTVFTPPNGFMGISTLLKYAGVSRSTGSPLTVSTTRDYISVVDVVFPWDGSVPLF